MALSKKTNRPINTINLAKKVVTKEIEAIISLKRFTINKVFEDVINILLKTRGKIILTGVGKSGIIAQKISSTLISLSFKSIFIHPVEALHGDMGLVEPGDIIIALSNSGESYEINKFISIVKKRKIKIISITANPLSKLAKLSDYVLNLKLKNEACPNNIIPTSSTTTMLVLGDAIAITLMQAKGYKKEDFVVNHPGGNIGKLLYLKVSEIMRTGKDLPLVKRNTTVKEVIKKMTQTRLGAVIVVDKNNKLVGYFTDGDLRRKFELISINDPIYKYMTENPVSINLNEKAIDAAKILDIKKIDNIPVVDNKRRVVGIVDERDLIREGFL